MRNKKELIKHIANGNPVNYVFFWGHRQTTAKTTKACFSQWFAAGFTLDGIHYQTAEHYMMAEKARLFADKAAEQSAIAASTPGDAKKIGRSVKGFNDAQWQEKRFSIVVTGNLAKFSQHPALKSFLLTTQDSVLVEASPIDPIWGIGLAADDPRRSQPLQWPGENLLGFALMEVRSLLRKNH